MPQYTHKIKVPFPVWQFILIDSELCVSMSIDCIELVINNIWFGRKGH